MGTPWWWHIGGLAIVGLLLGSACPAGPAAEGGTNDSSYVTDTLAPGEGVGLPPRARAVHVSNSLAALGSDAGRKDLGADRALYLQLCAGCHGTAGKGDGPSAVTMAVKPADHTDPVAMGRLTDSQIFDIIKRGGAAMGKFVAMPAWGDSLNDQQIWDLVRYIRALHSPR